MKTKFTSATPKTSPRPAYRLSCLQFLQSSYPSIYLSVNIPMNPNDR